LFISSFWSWFHDTIVALVGAFICGGGHNAPLLSLLFLSWLWLLNTIAIVGAFICGGGHNAPLLSLLFLSWL
jgi:hypothetical protein